MAAAPGPDWFAWPFGPGRKRNRDPDRLKGAASSLIPLDPGSPTPAQFGELADHLRRLVGLPTEDLSGDEAVGISRYQPPVMDGGPTTLSISAWPPDAEGLRQSEDTNGALPPAKA